MKCTCDLYYEFTLSPDAFDVEAVEKPEHRVGYIVKIPKFTGNTGFAKVMAIRDSGVMYYVSTVNLPINSSNATPGAVFADAVHVMRRKADFPEDPVKLPLVLNEGEHACTRLCQA